MEIIMEPTIMLMENTCVDYQQRCIDSYGEFQVSSLPVINFTISIFVQFIEKLSDFLWAEFDARFLKCDMYQEILSQHYLQIGYFFFKLETQECSCNG